MPINAAYSIFIQFGLFKKDRAIETALETERGRERGRELKSA